MSSEAAKEIRELKRKVSELERTIEILSGAAGFFARARPAAPLICAFIDAHRDRTRPRAPGPGPRSASGPAGASGLANWPRKARAAASTSGSAVYGWPSARATSQPCTASSSAAVWPTITAGASIPAIEGMHSRRERYSRYTSSMTDMTTIKVSVQTRDRLKRLADEDHLTMDGELARTLDKAEEARFWEGVRADYARLQADPQEWADYVSELAEWDYAVGDGLDDE